MKDSTAITLVVGGGLLILVGVPTGIYFATAETANVRGAIAIHNQNQDGTNRIAAADTWNTYNKDVLRDQANIAIVRQGLQEGASDPSMLTDALSACNTDVTSYNALADQLTIKDWRPADLPVSYDASVMCK